MATHPAADARDSREAMRLYRAIFREDPTPLWVERFLGASALLDASATAQDRAAYRRALACVGDLEALEVAARYRRKLPLLSDSFRLVVYLAESEPHTQPFFVKRRPSRVAAFAAVAWGAVCSIYKLVKGTVLLARVGDV